MIAHIPIYLFFFFFHLRLFDFTAIVNHWMVKKRLHRTRRISSRKNWFSCVRLWKTKMFLHLIFLINRNWFQGLEFRKFLKIFSHILLKYYKIFKSCWCWKQFSFMPYRIHERIFLAIFKRDKEENELLGCQQYLIL